MVDDDTGVFKDFQLPSLLLEYMGLDKIDNMSDVSFYDFITCFKPIKNYDIIKAYCQSKKLQFLSDSSIKQLYVKRCCQHSKM